MPLFCVKINVERKKKKQLYPGNKIYIEDSSGAKEYEINNVVLSRNPLPTPSIERECTSKLENCDKYSFSASYYRKHKNL